MIRRDEQSEIEMCEILKSLYYFHIKFRILILKDFEFSMTFRNFIMKGYDGLISSQTAIIFKTIKPIPRTN